MAVIPLGLAAAELVATPDGPMWPLEASSSRLLRLRLEEAAMPPPTPTPAPGAPIEVLPAEEKRPAAEPRALLVDAGIAIGGGEVCEVGQDAVLAAGAAPLGPWIILMNTVMEDRFKSDFNFSLGKMMEGSSLVRPFLPMGEISSRSLVSLGYSTFTASDSRWFSV